MTLRESPTEELDRLSDSSVGIGVGKTREEYLRSFARPCASPQYTRPYSSPTSGFYDAINTSTSLILLNKRFRNSHLREPTVIEEFNNVSENFAETNRPQLRQTSKSPRPPPVDPHRHFDSIVNRQGQNKYWHNRRCASSCVGEHSKKANEQQQQQRASRLSRRSTQRSVCSQRNVPSARLQPESSLAEYQIDSTFTKSFYPSARDSPEKFKQSEFDFQPTPTKSPKIKTNLQRQKTLLTENQQLYLLTKARIYDTKNTKIRRNNSYTQVLADRLKADIQCKPQFRLNDPTSLAKYASFCQPTRPITTSSFSMRSNDLSVTQTKPRILAPHLTMRQFRPPLIQI